MSAVKDPFKEVRDHDKCLYYQEVFRRLIDTVESFAMRMPENDFIEIIENNKKIYSCIKCYDSEYTISINISKADLRD